MDELARPGVVVVLIDVDTVGYESARDTFYNVNNDLFDTAWALSSALQGGAGMAGADSDGAEWATSYDSAAAQALEAACLATTTTGEYGDLLAATGANHYQAESSSTLGSISDQSGWVVDGSRGKGISTSAPASANGSPGDEPPGWDLVAGAMSWVWPNGDQEQLRTIGAAWATAGSDFAYGSYGLSPAISQIEAQRSPEVDAAVQTCTDLQTQIAEIGEVCSGLSQACNDYAAHLDEAHQEVIDELVSLLEWTIGIEVAGAAMAFFSIGTSVAAAQAAVAARIATAVTRIGLTLTRLAGLVRLVIASVARFATRIGEVLGKLKGLVGKKAETSVAEAGSAIVKPTIQTGKQGKHIPGHNNFIPGKSELTGDATKLVEKAGTGTPVGNIPRGEAGFKERIDFGEEIGIFVTKSGERLPTTNGIMHYAADGSVHIVPARPTP